MHHFKSHKNSKYKWIYIISALWKNNGITIPAGTRKEDIKVREKIIKDFYAKWISEHPDKKI